MKIRIFALRNAREILRDPINLFFGLGFPLVLLLLLTAIQSSVPVPLFELPHLTPGIGVFGLSFITLFAATIIAKDRRSAFLQRLYTTPMRPVDFILGYTLPLVPIALTQSLICYMAAVLLGMESNLNILWCVLFALPVAVMFSMAAAAEKTLASWGRLFSASFGVVFFMVVCFLMVCGGVASRRGACSVPACVAGAWRPWWVRYSRNEPAAGFPRQGFRPAFPVRQPWRRCMLPLPGY